MLPTLQVSYGLDLAGYSSGGSSLAKAATRDGESIEITLLHESAFSVQAAGKESIADVNQREINELRHILKSGILVVDVCLDLQGLPNPQEPHRVWQLTRRPVDRAFTALTPLADKIGAYVARMQRLMSVLEMQSLLGNRIFETYPAASLELMKLNDKLYKGIAKYQEGSWCGLSSNDKPTYCKNEKLAANLNFFGWTAIEGFTVTHDDFDAALCALTGIASPSHRLEKTELDREIGKRLFSKGDVDQEGVPDMRAPDGYILLQLKFGNVNLTESKEVIFNAQ